MRRLPQTRTYAGCYSFITMLKGHVAACEAKWLASLQQSLIMRDQGDSVFLSRARDSVSPKRIVTKREGAGQRKLDVRLGDWTKRSEEKVEGGHRTRKERQETSLIRDFGDLKQRTRCRHTRLPLAATGSPSRAEEQRRSCSPAPSLPKNETHLLPKRHR